MHPARRALSGRVSLLLGAALVVACADDGPIGPGTPSAARIEIVSGDDQSGFPRRTLADSLRVKVTDPSGAPMPNVTVLWETEDGAASPERSTTNAAGIATTAWSPGDAAVAALRARVLNRDLGVGFAATVDGFVLDCAPDSVVNQPGDLRVVGCGVSGVGEFAGLVTLRRAAGFPDIQVGFASGTLDLTETDGPVATSVLLSIDPDIPRGAHPLELQAVRGADTATAKIVVTIP